MQFEIGLFKSHSYYGKFDSFHFKGKGRGVLANIRCCDMFSSMFCKKKTTRDNWTKVHICGKVLKQEI